MRASWMTPRRMGEPTPKPKHRFVNADGNSYRCVDMFELLGVKGSKWPDAGVPARLVQGVWVHVLPVDHVTLHKRDGKKGSKHRVIAACPTCGVAVSAGRLFQHICETKRRGRKIDRCFQLAALNVSKMRAKPVLDVSALARAALVAPFDTQEHEDAHNAFCLAVEPLMTVKQRHAWEAWNLKATNDEIVTEALRVLGLPVPDQADIEAVRNSRPQVETG